MPTDNYLAADFTYISKRLVKEIVQQRESRRGRLLKHFEIRLPIVSMSFESKYVDYDNEFELVQRATEIVSDHTGTLLFPGQYVRAELGLCQGSLKVLFGWEKQQRVEIAAMKACCTIDENRSTFVGLFGSMSNYRYQRPKTEDYREIASDAAGLYRILHETTESEDPKVERRRIKDESNVVPGGHVDTAMRFLLGRRYSGSPEMRCDVLLKVFYSSDGPFEYDNQYFDQVLIGAPIWVATCET